jgi:SOS-response transcriptional repressor LexA
MIGVRAMVALALSGRDRAWLVRKSRLGVNTVARLLRDTTAQPRPITLEKVTRALGVSAAWLTAGGTRHRALNAEETDELLRCVATLHSLALGSRTDSRSEPNVRHESKLRVPPHFRASGARQVYRVRGCSLARSGLLDRDLAYVKPTENLRDAVGSIVVAQLNGALYLKRLTIEAGGVVALHSACDGYDALIVGDDDDFKLMGRVTAFVRETR